MLSQLIFSQKSEKIKASLKFAFTSQKLYLFFSLNFRQLLQNQYMLYSNIKQ